MDCTFLVGSVDREIFMFRLLLWYDMSGAAATSLNVKRGVVVVVLWTLNVSQNRVLCSVSIEDSPTALKNFWGQISRRMPMVDRGLFCSRSWQYFTIRRTSLPEGHIEAPTIQQFDSIVSLNFRYWSSIASRHFFHPFIPRDRQNSPPLLTIYWQDQP